MRGGGLILPATLPLTGVMSDAVARRFKVPPLTYPLRAGGGGEHNMCAHGKGPPGGLRGLPAPLTTTSYLRGRGRSGIFIIS